MRCRGKEDEKRKRGREEGGYIKRGRQGVKDRSRKDA